MGLPRFTRPKGGDGESSPNLCVANCGPAVGLSFETIISVFGTFGEVKGVYAADESDTRVIVKDNDTNAVSTSASDLNIPGVYLVHDFVTAKEEEVNDYPPGIGLSPHIDTHSAFEGSIFSLSLASPCIMEFRLFIRNFFSVRKFATDHIFKPNFILCSGKVDKVKDSEIQRGPRRVSLTLRKVRKGPCQCEFPQYCDSQN
ncbi:unnamed protein product [Fraxinus pennsylvanica]|uniref:RRM domain-containing protein n=1 Tax=Fraxinus pennsylvanica TaxID=56036 RepID=A0AAD2AET1_9LAMI|nr:unnamed protein product [Fraxinus pennsylvanica]